MVTGRIDRIERGTARGSAKDREKLSELAELLRAIDTDHFSKYQSLLSLFRDIGWTGGDRRERLVIFSSESNGGVAGGTPEGDLQLDGETIGRIDGGSVEADEKTQRLLEDFGQENAPIRILLASDIASKGLNLHFQSHRLIHFDLPWSLLRFQQRNGRIDRYGQDRAPQIYYFVGESSHPRSATCGCSKKLVEKDAAAQKGLGDPAGFLGAGDAELEEEVVAAAVSAGIGAAAFGAEMEARAEAAGHAPSVDEELDALFGDYAGIDHSATASTSPMSGTPPRLFADTFSYARAVLQRRPTRKKDFSPSLL